MTTNEFVWPALAISQAWQIAALALLVTVVVRLTARNRPHLAHVLWLLVLVKCVTPPLWSSPAGVFSWAESELSSPSHPAAPIPETPSPAVRDVDPTVLPRDLALFEREADEVMHLSPAQEPALRPAEAPISNHASQFLGRVVATILYLDGLTIAWCLGSLILTSVAAARWMRCWRQLHVSREVADPQLAQAFDALTKQLGLRRRVRLLVSSSRIGPAVVGLFRPTVVLPLAVVEGRSIDDLLPILAHELLHVRRGDLWIGLLQVVAQTVWWFHPLVWLTGRMISREAERCCDEEVLAELGCSPARYARSLLAVLELKRTLVPVPAFPGVRAVDVTSSRLERIMRLGQGCRRRTPWWCWMVLLLAAIAVLPGSALLSGDTTPPIEFDPGPQPAPMVQRKTVDKPDQPLSEAAAQLAGLDDPLPRPNSGHFVSNRVYDVRPLIAAAQQELHITEEAARDAVMEMLFKRLSLDRVENHPPRNSLELDYWQGGIYFRGDSEPGGELKRMGMRLNPQGEISVQLRPHRPVDPAPFLEELVRVERVLDEMRQHGFRTIKLEVRMIYGRPEYFNGLMRSWPLAPTMLSGDEGNPRAEMRADAIPRHMVLGNASRARTSVEEIVPMRQVILDDDHHRKLLKLLEKDPGTSQLQAPKVTLFSGQTASICDVSQSPFVVGLQPVPGKEGVVEPQIRIVTEGMQFNTRATIIDDVVQLDYRLLLADIKEVRTQELATLGNVQVPVLSRTTVESNFALPLDRTLALGGFELIDMYQQPSAFLLLIKATTPEREEVVEVRDGHVDGTMRADWSARVIPLAELPQHLALTLQNKAIVEHSDPLPEVRVEHPGVLAAVPLSANRLLLDPKRVGSTRLTWQDADEKPQEIQIHVMSPETHEADNSRAVEAPRSARAMIAVTYGVEDLVLPKSAFQRDKEKQEQGAQADFEVLIELIETTIAPTSWDSVGGAGSIQAFPTNLSLVIKNTRDVHEELTELLRQLRRLSEAQAELSVYTIDDADRLFRELAMQDQPGHGKQWILRPDQVRKLERSKSGGAPLLVEGLLNDARVGHFKEWSLPARLGRSPQSFQLLARARSAGGAIELLTYRSLAEMDRLPAFLNNALPLRTGRKITSGFESGILGGGESELRVEVM